MHLKLYVSFSKLFIKPLIFNNEISCFTHSQNGKKAVIPYIIVPKLRVSSLYLVHMKMEAKTQTKLKIQHSTK